MRRHSTIQNPKSVAYVICLGIAEFQVIASNHYGSEALCFLLIARAPNRIPVVG